MLDVVKLRRLIKDQDQTLFAFGRRIGIDHTQVSRWLNGAQINLTNVRKLAVGLGVTVDALLLDEPQQSAQ